MNLTNPQPIYLSIVVPLYNEEESVEKLLLGLLEVGRQFEFAYEIILVDDGSTDRTWDNIERLKKTTLQLRAIKFRRNYGQTSSRKAMTSSADGAKIVKITFSGCFLPRLPMQLFHQPRTYACTIMAVP